MCPLLFDACSTPRSWPASSDNVYQWIHLGLRKITTGNVNDHSNYS